MFNYSALGAGIDVPVEALSLIAHQPRLKELAMMGEDNMLTAIRYICLDKDWIIQDKTLSSTITNFQVLMKVILQPEAKEIKGYILQLLAFVFPDYSVTILPTGFILLRPDFPTVTIDENTFPAFQEAMGEIFCANYFFNKDDDYNINEDDANARRIKEKIMEGRKRLAEIKNKGKKGGSNIISQYVSILSVGLKLNVNDIWNTYTLYQLLDQFERYDLYYNWKNDFSARLAGADIKESPENWRKNIHE